MQVLGESYTPEDEEDSAVATVGTVWVYQARYRVPVARATAGNLVLIEGVDATITRTATLVADAYDEPVHIFRWGRWRGFGCGGVCVRLHPQGLDMRPAAGMSGALAILTLFKRYLQLRWLSNVAPPGLVLFGC